MKRDASINNNFKSHENRAFCEWLNNMSPTEHCDTVKLIAARCNVVRTTIYAWKYMSVRIPNFAKGIICEVAERDIFAREIIFDNEDFEGDPSLINDL